MWRPYALEAKYEVVKLRRMPMYAVPTLAFPVMFYLLFGIAMSGSRAMGGQNLAGYLIGSYGAFGVIGAGLFAFGVGVAVERAQGWLMVKRASPMSLGAYIFGKVAASMAFAFAIVAILGLCGILLGGVRFSALQWLAIVAVLVLGTAPFCAIGLALGYMAGPNSSPAIVNLVHLPTSLASGLWMPLFMLPRFMRAIAPWLPQYHLGQLALTVTGGATDTNTAGHIMALALWTVIGVAAAAWAYRRDEGRLYG